MNEKTSLIISTYNWESALEQCLASVLKQTQLPDEVIIADDGSGPETKALIDEWAARLPYPIRHVWHEDQGFEKCRILNTAIESSDSEFLIFMDGDVLVHPDFLKRHYDLCMKGRFSTGSVIRLDDQATTDLTEEAIVSRRIFLGQVFIMAPCLSPMSLPLFMHLFFAAF